MTAGLARARQQLSEQSEVPSSRVKEMTVEGSAADVGFSSSMDAAGSGKTAIHGHDAMLTPWAAMRMVWLCMRVVRASGQRQQRHGCGGSSSGSSSSSGGAAAAAAVARAALCVCAVLQAVVRAMSG